MERRRMALGMLGVSHVGVFVVALLAIPVGDCSVAVASAATSVAAPVAEVANGSIDALLTVSSNGTLAQASAANSSAGNASGLPVVAVPVSEVANGSIDALLTVSSNGILAQASAANSSAGNASGLPVAPAVADAGERARSNSFDYHKEPFPLDWEHDGRTILIATVGLIIAASGGIGGGGILVPIFMLVLKFRPKHAVALSNITIFGGAIANTALNAPKRHPKRSDRHLIDWDIIVMMEPLTIFGAVFGSLVSKVLPNILLTTSLVVVLCLMGHHTMGKGINMWKSESKQNVGDASLPSVELVRPSGADFEAEAERPYLEMDSDCEAARKADVEAESSPRMKITTLTLCFVGIGVLNLLRGGGNFPSPFGFECGSLGYWVLYFGSVPWVCGFAWYFRALLQSEFKQKIRGGHVFLEGDVQWNDDNAIRYPALCALSGLLAGLFGVGGGIVKGPLMLEMGVIPSVASASAAAMILYTSASASISFAVFGLLHPVYGLIFFLLGFVCTMFGQYTVGQWVKRYKRQSPIVLSIGAVISLSAVLVGLESAVALMRLPFSELIRVHGLCTLEV